MVPEVREAEGRQAVLVEEAHMEDPAVAIQTEGLVEEEDQTVVRVEEVQMAVLEVEGPKAVLEAEDPKAVLEVEDPKAVLEAEGPKAVPEARQMVG